MPAAVTQHQTLSAKNLNLAPKTPVGSKKPQQGPDEALKPGSIALSQVSDRLLARR